MELRYFIINFGDIRMKIYFATINLVFSFPTQETFTATPSTTIYQGSASTIRQFTELITSSTLGNFTESTVETVTDDETQTDFVSTTEVITTETGSTDTTSTITIEATSSVLTTQETFTTGSSQSETEQYSGAHLNSPTQVLTWYEPVTSGGQYDQTSYSICQENNFSIHNDCIRSCSAGQVSCYEHCNRELVENLQLCCLLDQTCSDQNLTTAAPSTTIYQESASTTRQFTELVTSSTLAGFTSTVETITDGEAQTDFVSTTESITTETGLTDTTSTTTIEATSSVLTTELHFLIITLLCCLN